MAAQLSVLIKRDALKKRVSELAERISADFEGKDLVVVAVLKGAFVFASDLVRKVSVPVSLEFVAVSLSGGARGGSGVLRITKDLDAAVEGKSLLIVDDLVDSGLTTAYLRRKLASLHPESVSVCALLLREGGQKVGEPPEYVGFAVGPSRLVGYGLDYNERFRHLPEIYELKGEEWI